jgi:hypothetical protein
MKRPLIVIDTLTVMHMAFDLRRHPITKQVLHKLPNKARDQKCLDTKNLYESGYMFPELLKQEPEILWVGDDKSEPYWRHLEYRRLEAEGKITHTSKGKPSGYKGGRDSCPYQQWIAKRLYSYTKAWTVPGYEADDLAAAVVATADRPVYLITIDTDWMQLVSDQVTWVCVKGHPPGVRSLANFSIWFDRKLEKAGKKIREQLDTSNPKDIVTWKVLAGDSSDNLPKGTPRHMFDLLEPRSDMKLWEHMDVPLTVRQRAVPVKKDDGLARNNWIIENDGRLPTPVYPEIG